MAACAWCTKPKPRLAVHWKNVGDTWFCPEHGHDWQIAQTLERTSTCGFCGGDRPKDGTGWRDDGGTAYCPGCWRLESGDASGLAECVRSDIAAARRLIRACDEIDDGYRRLADEDAAAQAAPWRKVIADLGEALSDLGGEAAMRRALLLVRADADPDHLVTVLAGGTELDPARKTTLASHISYIGREWNGIGSWME
jgi:hypothetical protein